MWLQSWKPLSNFVPCREFTVESFNNSFQLILVDFFRFGFFRFDGTAKFDRKCLRLLEVFSRKTEILSCFHRSGRKTRFLVLLPLFQSFCSGKYPITVFSPRAIFLIKHKAVFGRARWTVA